MEANTTTASPVIPASAPISQGRATEGVQSRGDQGDSSAAFSQRTNVSIETAIDHLADILSKVSGRQQTNVQQMPQELKEVIQNMIRQSFSLETTLAQGLGSTAASQRFSTDQLTTLARTLNQLGTMAETGNAPQVGDELAALLTGLKSALAKEASGTFEPIMLTKAAFQLLDTGNAELLPKELKAFLPQLNAQGGAQAALLGNAGSTSLSFLNQLVQLLMPREVTGGAAQTALQNPAGGQDAQIASLAKNANTAMIEEPALDQQMPRAQTSALATDALAKENTTATLRQAGNMPQESVAKTPGAPAQNPQTSANETGNAQMGTNPSERGQNAATPTGTQQTAQFGKETAEAGTRTSTNAETQASISNPQGEAATRAQAGRQTELPNAPAQSTTQMKSAEMQNTIPRFLSQTMENTPQTMNALRNLAQTLLQNENLSQREALLLQNFVSGRSQTLSEGDAKQLQQLIQLTQQNIPGTVRQAALEQQLPDLPRLWAFMQMADIVKTRRMTAEQYKRASRDVAALALTMRNALEGENSAPQPGQRSMNFVMPLFMGASEYPAYIHVYDEAHQDEETDRVKKETWLRICVLTDNIGTVELINRIYEENHVDMRLYFSDADAAWEFRHVLDEIRETADGTSLVIEGIQIGAIGERRFFTN